MVKFVTSQFNVVKQNALRTRYIREYTFRRVTMLSYIPRSKYHQKTRRFLKTHHYTKSQCPKIIYRSFAPNSQARKKVTLWSRGSLPD
jgi:transposase